VFFALILLHLLHLAAGLFHALVRRDRSFQSMPVGSMRDADAATAAE
jgi:cytochrome b561